VLSEDLRARKAAESAQTARNVELEAVVNSQAERIAELETVYADMKCEKESITAGYRRLSDKHKTLIEKAEREKAKLIEAHATKLAMLQGDLDLETRIYTDYHQSVRCWLRELQETVALSFNEIQA
jgi:predicted nuclease with TOPRIM domain